jgi:hypothetical protein
VKEEVEEMVDELLFTDVARSCLCSDRDFAFSGKNRKVFARLNRVELGDDDALAIGLFLLTRYKGQVIIEDGGFYLRDMHVSLIREGRLITRVNHLEELPLKLRKTALQMSERSPTARAMRTPSSWRSATATIRQEPMSTTPSLSGMA